MNLWSVHLARKINNSEKTPIYDSLQNRSVQNIFLDDENIYIKTIVNIKNIYH